MEISCISCGEDTLVVREAVYDGFKKTGEQFVCAACGHIYEDESLVPFKASWSAPSVFSDEDRSARPDVFAEGENKQLCRHCRNYIINPFTQWCSLHKKEVEATDSCDRFMPMGDEKPAPI